jgi:uncharacterized protein
MERERFRAQYQPRGSATMATSLYDLSVSGYVQTVAAAGKFMEKGLAYCTEQQIDPESIVETRLYPDMLPFRFQIESIVHHSVDALAGLRGGEFFLVGEHRPQSYRELQASLQSALEQLQKLTREEVDALEGGEVFFRMGEHKVRFKAVDFVLSFSLPNFHFHATTAYDILRSKGVPLGKRDYMGRLRLLR